MRCRHTSTPAAIANSPKNTPVSSNQSTPPARAAGFQTASPNRRPPRFTPAATLPARRPALQSGVTCTARPLPARGFGLLAASTARTTAFAVSRTPTPSARPNRSASITNSLNPASKPQRRITKPMKSFLFLIAGITGAIAYMIVKQAATVPAPAVPAPVVDLAHKLQDAWADHHTVA